jgi:cation transport regulator ChaC
MACGLFRPRQIFLAVAAIRFGMPWSAAARFSSIIAQTCETAPMLYFAYGSNMSPKQMQARCPGARPLGPAELCGWRFMITKRGTANIRPGKDARLFGVLWRCLPHHLAMLDRYEAVRLRVYRRRIVVVRLSDGRRLHAIAYVSNLHQQGIARREYLKTAVLPGAEAFRLPEAFLAEIGDRMPTGRVGTAKPRYRGRRH